MKKLLFSVVLGGIVFATSSSALTLNFANSSDEYLLDQSFEQDGFYLGDGRFVSGPIAETPSEYRISDVNWDSFLHIEDCCGPFSSSYVLAHEDGLPFDAHGFSAVGNVRTYENDKFEMRDLRAPNIGVTGYRDGEVVAEAFFQTVDYDTRSQFSFGSAFDVVDRLVFSGAAGRSPASIAALAQLQSDGFTSLNYFTDVHSSVFDLDLTIASDSEPVAPVPLPAGALLLLSALGFMFVGGKLNPSRFEERL